MRRVAMMGHAEYFHVSPAIDCASCGTGLQAQTCSYPDNDSCIIRSNARPLAEREFPAQNGDQPNHLIRLGEARMDQDSFIRELQTMGFSEITTVRRAPNGALGTHTHPFEARALILTGQIRIVCGDEGTTYQAGEVFHLARETEHEESYGPEGVSYLVGRK